MIAASLLLAGASAALAILRPALSDARADWHVWEITPQPVSGVVYEDRNGNGKRDAGERGMRGIVVSNQNDVVLTDSLGRFELGAAPTGVVFVSVPDGYRSIGRFWREVNGGSQALEFALQPEKQPRTFKFVHSSDSHIEPKNVDRVRRVHALADSAHAAFVLVGGDLVRDAMSLPESLSTPYFDLFAAESRRFDVPVWTVPGNHDHFGIIRSRSHVDPSHPLYGRGKYRHYFGPDYYSFTYGGVHFIGLNTIAIDDSAYYGYVDSLQLEWLKRDVARIPATMPVVTFGHIPMASGWWSMEGVIDEPLVGHVARASGRQTYRHTVGNVLEVLDALRQSNYVLALSSHTHVAERLEFVMSGRAIRFETSAAIVGGSRVGPFEFPSGITVYTVRNGEIDRGSFVNLDSAGRAAVTP